MPDASDLLAALRAARNARDTAARQSHAARIGQVALQREAKRVERVGDRERERALAAALARQKEIVTACGREVEDAAAEVGRLIGDLHEAFTPERLTSFWSADTPILLMPLRVETRFKSGALLVRVFPDEIAIDTHEEILTGAEQVAGQAWWRGLVPDPGETARKEAWRRLVETFRAPRSAYIVRRTRPINWADRADVGADGLVFPDEPILKNDAWTEAPRVKVLPDRFVLLLSRAGTVIRREVGKAVPDIVLAGPAPLIEDGKASWERDKDGNIVFDEGSRWLRDFDMAVDQGLGFRVGLGRSDEGGFDELLLVGLKHSADRDESEALLSELLVGHHFSTKGLSLVPQGAATNNTSTDDGALDSQDWFADASFLAQDAVLDAPAPAPDPDLATASDGERLAAYLGLAPDLLSGVPNAGRRDHAEAVAMNAALYPGTLGYFLRTMIGGVTGEATLDALQAFFIYHVSGRGPLPAIRVGNQPYGFLLAGPAPGDHEREVVRGPLGIDRAIERIIARARPWWTRFLPSVARLGQSAHGSTDLLAVLGLQPTAAEYFQRIATTYDHLANLAGFGTGGDRMDEVFAAAFAGFFADGTLRDLGYQRQRPDGSQKPYPLLFQLIFQQHQTELPLSALIDGTPFSEKDPVRPYNAAGTKNYIDWLAANARNAEALRRQDFGGAQKPSFLLYMLLRHALLIQTGTSVNRWLKLFEVEAPELVTSRKFLGLTDAVDVAAWEILGTPARAVANTLDSDLPLMTLVHLPEYRVGANAAIGAPLDAMLSAYGTLRGLPTARLERLFAEHVDTLSYRLDAWETALTDRRLLRQRALRKEGAGAVRGLYLGAFGYLENVRPAPGRRRRIEENVLPEALRGGTGDLYAPVTYAGHEPAGYVHAPSLNHATAAAVLRNGYLTHATPTDPDRLAVNLTSRRVRRAKELMDGVRNGQSVEVLLGIEFERGLHDATTRPVRPVVLNDLKPAFRAAFPINRTHIPKAGHSDDGPKIVPDYTVVNGIAIAATPDTFPGSVSELPALTADQQTELKAIRMRVRDSLDAMKDVMTAESAYQLALGNFDRAAAIVQTMSAALALPETEVQRSSRGTDIAFTQRLTIEFDPAVGGNPWPGIPPTPRAVLEPPINAWLGTMLGDPSLYACNVTLTLEGAPAVKRPVRLSELQLPPLDCLRLARALRDEGGPAEFEARIGAVALADPGMNPAMQVAVAFGETGLADPAVAPMADALALLDLAHQVLGSARPLDGRDALTNSKPLPIDTEPSGIDIVDLRGRCAALKAAADVLANDLAAAATPADLRAKLRTAADFGVPYAFPVGPDGALADQAKAVGTVLAGLIDQATALEAASQAAGLSLPEQAERLIAAVQALLGADFRVLPRFTASNATDIAASDAARDAILAFAKGGDAAVDPVSEVLTSVAHVRGAVHRVFRLCLMEELATGVPSPLAAIQLPPRADDVWLGAALPSGYEIFHDTLSLIQLRPQGFSPAAQRCGLMVDEWTESFPRKTEVTGIAFGFDQPNSTPPQALLLAVAGDGEESWSFDALVSIIRDTLLRAKLRAVEPDMLDTLPGVTALLPATMAEFSTSVGALSLDFGLAVPMILTEALATAYGAELKKAETP